jgi:hypothetical protein
MVTYRHCGYVLLAVLAFIASNFGGFFIGMLLGITGGSMSFGWTPSPDQPARRPPARCREAPVGSAHQVKGLDRRGPRHQETTMPKYLLLKHYRGGPEPHRPVPPMDQWAPEDVEAHMAFLRHVGELLEKNGEYVDAQALTPARTWVRYGGPDAAPVTTDGPLPETSDLVAGWYMIDVESHERAVELAAYVSSEPGPGGEALYEWIDVREVMSEAPSEETAPA